MNMKTRLTMRDLCGDILDKYEAQYQDILKKFRDGNTSAQQYREDLKVQKLKENRDSAISQARELKKNFDKEILDRLTEKKTEYEQKLKQQPKNADDVFKGLSYTDTIPAAKALYKAIERNTKMMQASTILSYGHIPSIEEFLDKNIENKDILEMIEAYVKSQPNREADFQGISAKLADARTTEVDDINSLLGIARFNAAQSDVVATSIFPHNIEADFANLAAKNSYFSGSQENPYFK